MWIEVTDDEIKEIHSAYREGTRIDFESGRLMLDSLPVIWTRASILYNMYIEMKKIVGEAVHALMHTIGKAYGINFYVLTINRLKDENNEVTREKILKYLCAETGAIGWGRISIEDLPGKVTIVAKKGCPVGHEAREKKKLLTEPVDAYFLGYFEGFISCLNNRDFSGQEVKCVGKGDEECLMVFKPTEG